MTTAQVIAIFLLILGLCAVVMIGIMYYKEIADKIKRLKEKKKKEKPVEIPAEIEEETK